MTDLTTPCKIWHKSKNHRGYGQTWHNGKNVKVHRLIWQALYGPIPEGLVINHLCHTEAIKNDGCNDKQCQHRACYNIEHLEVVTQKENMAYSAWSIEARTHCRQGHEWNERNLYIRKNGARECAECNRVRAKAAYAAKKVS